MAATAIKRPLGGGSGENMYEIEIKASGKVVGWVRLKKDAFDAALAQDKTDITVHVSSTIQALGYHTETTIS